MEWQINPQTGVQQGDIWELTNPEIVGLRGRWLIFVVRLHENGWSWHVWNLLTQQMEFNYGDFRKGNRGGTGLEWKLISRLDPKDFP